MNTDTKATVMDIIAAIAPDADLNELAGDQDLREALDIDSMDHLNIIIAIHDRFGIEIPERDYGKLVTVDQLLTYIESKRAN
ncbi:acyl carrier protein [Fodinicurvata sp. EGI_FJ10296]|uniref:acyl carrier protein n=1 Tax=Fodinicurvata sp. EGI_FJ10296 TaxID=3231908 RepID=UPI0034519C48